MSWIEELAFRYVQLAEFPLYNFVFIYISAAVTGWIKPVDSLMQRSTYFLNTALVALAATIGQLIWLQSIDAMASGYLIVLVVLDILIWFAAGYFYVLIAKARSNDGYGHARFAVLAFIPLANLWLLFKPSQTSYAPKLPWYLSGVGAVMLAFVVSGVARGAGVAIEQSVAASSARVTPEDASVIRDKYFDFYARTDGISAALEYLKSLEPVGQKIDEITFSESVDVSGSELRYRMRITDESVTSFNSKWANQVRTQLCDQFDFVRSHGGVVIFEYFSATRGTLVEIIASDQTCT